MEAERVTYPVAWPHQWARLAEAPNWANDLSSLRYVEAGAPLRRHPTVATDWSEPRWCYGATESFTIVTAFPTGTPPELTGETHGEPLPGNTVKIVDPLSGALLPRGEHGEIAVRGPTLMLGYLGAAADETLDEHGFFHTGDGGWMDARGRLTFEGRLGDIIKTGGANVSPVEVDVALAGCPGVRHSQTVGAAHETLGEIVVSCIVLEDGFRLDEAAIDSFLRTRLASYKVPRRVMFVRDEELSFTGSNKVRTRALREFVRLRLQVGRADT
jgi:acyl-CoA synthetase (AMP-forming)/AMP-acid ligase II